MKKISIVLALSLALGCSSSTSTSSPQAIAAPVGPAPIVTLVHGFDSDAVGYHPRGSLVRGPDDRMYGTAWSGTTAAPSGGSVFAVDLVARSIVALHTFSPLDSRGQNDDGYGSTAEVTVGPDGRLYGTARQGGHSAATTQPGVGTLWSMLPNGTDFRVLHMFGSAARFADGATPGGGATSDGRGVFYGATSAGGTGGMGAIWRWDGTTLTAIHSFEALDRTTTPPRNNGGAGPYGSPTISSSGTLVGLTIYGGKYGRGTVYELDPTASVFRVLYDFPPYTFAGNTDNAPLQRPMLSRAGSLWLADEYGGPNGTGIVLKIERTATVVHAFGVYDLLANPRFSNGDGALPLGTLMEGPDGKIYGTTYYGAAHGYGGIWRMDPDGTNFELVYSFDSVAHDASSVGAFPAVGLTMGPGGVAIGATFLGSTVGGGGVYEYHFN